MKNYRYYYILLAMLLAGIFAFPARGVASRVEGEEGRVCFSCHPEVKKKLYSQNGHLPVEKGRCVECHNPHTSNHDKLLGETGGGLCYQCHQKMEKKFTREFTHLPVENGECTKCHLPHSSNNRSLLKEEKSKICFTCHPQEKIFSRKNVHSPLKAGNCMKCHNPHAADNEFLLVKDGKKICISCHSAKDQKLIKLHNNFRLESADCLGCHNPHSSNRKSLVREFSHEPFAANKCSSCHTSLRAMKEGGRNLCLSCHQEVKKDFNKVFSHLLQGDRDNTCLECHNPHTSDDKGLKRARDDKICFSCHKDTKRRVEGKDPRYKYQHPMVKSGKCTGCHQPHGSDNRLFLASDENSTCENCHETQGKFTHPLGKDCLDPRSKRGMTCISCHNPMGSKDKYSLRFEQKKELCIQCHKYKT